MRDAVIEAATSNMMLTWLFFSFTFTAQLKDELCKKVHYLSLGSNKDAAAFSSETPLWCLRWSWEPLWCVRAAFNVYISVEVLQRCRMLHRWLPLRRTWTLAGCWDIPRCLQVRLGNAAHPYRHVTFKYSSAICTQQKKLTRIQQIAPRL